MASSVFDLNLNILTTGRIVMTLCMGICRHYSVFLLSERIYTKNIQFSCGQTLCGYQMCCRRSVFWGDFCSVIFELFSLPLSVCLFFSCHIFCFMVSDSFSLKLEDISPVPTVFQLLTFLDITSNLTLFHLAVAWIQLFTMTLSYHSWPHSSQCVFPLSVSALVQWKVLCQAE